MQGKDVLYNGQVLTLTKYFGVPCIFHSNTPLVSVPRMQCVGGYPNEYCIYISDLTDQEKSRITDLNGKSFNLEEEISKLQ